MTMEIILIRHGESEANARGVVQGRGDYPLSARGREQAGRTAEVLAGCGAGRVYASPLARARETAEIIARASGLEPVILADLIEYNLGAFEGLTPDEIVARYPEVPAGMKSGTPFHRLAPGAESDEDAGARARSGLDTILNSGLGRVIVVSHLGILECMIRLIVDGREIQGYERRPKDYLKNCSITRFELAAGHGRAVAINDVSHL